MNPAIKGPLAKPRLHEKVYIATDRTTPLCWSGSTAFMNTWNGNQNIAVATAARKAHKLGRVVGLSEVWKRKR